VVGTVNVTVQWEFIVRSACLNERYCFVLYTTERASPLVYILINLAVIRSGLASIYSADQKLARFVLTLDGFWYGPNQYETIWCQKAVVMKNPFEFGRELRG
jgi:hypothetical protein